MEKKPSLELVTGAQALDQLRQFPAPAHTGILHVPDQLNWPLVVPQGGLQVRLDPTSEQQLTYGLATGIIAFEDTFHLVARVDYAYGDQEETAFFRLDYGPDSQMLDTVAELGILALAAEVPPKFASREELADYLARTTVFVCELDAQEVHRLRIQLIRMQAQREHLGKS